MTFNATNIKDFRAELEKVLRDNFPGTRFELGSIKYNADFARFSVEAVRGMSQAELDLSAAMQRDGILTMESSSGDVLTGYNRRARKYPYEYVTADGKPMKVSVAGAQRMFA